MKSGRGPGEHINLLKYSVVTLWLPLSLHAQLRLSRVLRPLRIMNHVLIYLYAKFQSRIQDIKYRYIITT